MNFDLVIPCYNPAAGWEMVLISRLHALQTCTPAVFSKLSKIILVDDGSLRPVNARNRQNLIDVGFDVLLIRYPVNRGKGHAVRTGVGQSLSPLCLYTDLDIPFGVESLRDLFYKLETGADIAIGMRSKQAYYQAAPFARKMISSGLMWMNKFVLMLPVHDTQAGIKGFNRFGKAVLLETRTDRFLFDLEFIRRALTYRDINLIAVPVRNRKPLELSPFSWKTLRQEAGNFFIILWTTHYVFRTKKRFAWH